MENVMNLMETVLDQEKPMLSENDKLHFFQQINMVFKEKFLSLERRKICLFLPHCLRSRYCPAASDDEGVQCEKCGQCPIGELTTAAEEEGFMVFCVPGGSLLEKLVMKYRPKGIIGVACYKEILLGLKLLWDKGFQFQVFPLEKDGCFETEISPEPILSLLKSPYPY